MTKNRPFAASVIMSIFLTLAAGGGAMAQDRPDTGLMPPVGAINGAEGALNIETHPALRLTPDKSELVRLGREAASVMVGNSAHITVLLDTPTLAVVIPRAPGATYFSVLDKDGKVIMQRHVIVASPKKNYVRVRRSCANAPSDSNCRPTSVYFCRDMCHEIQDGAEAADDGAAQAPVAQ